MADTAEFDRQLDREEQPEREPRRGFFQEHPNAKWGLLAAAVILAVAGYMVWNYYSTRESTDDAQIDGHVNPISSKVGGTVVTVHVEDNQFVKAGTALVEIDQRDYKVALDKAQADLDSSKAKARAAETNIPIIFATSSSRLSSAKASLQAAQAGLAAARDEVAAAKAQLGAAQARIEESQARSALAQQDLERMKRLIARDEISKQQYDTAVTNAEVSAAAAESVKALAAQAAQGVPVAESRVAQAEAAVVEAQAGVRAAETAPQEVAVSKAQSGSAYAKTEQNAAGLAQARLNLEYTTIVAPVDGFVSRKSVEAGQVIAPGQPLLAIVPLEDVWITADFKETQLNHMRPGQTALIKVDAYGGREFRGRVDSVAAATGALFSLLPPENATGNYVKVVQRVPVKIVFEKGQDPGHL
ncbi:MAG: HlyD family secretion protein, partial [Bryobacteraceae bacterium]